MKVDGKEAKIETKSAAYYASTMSYSGPDGSSKALSVSAVIADYPLDLEHGMRTMNKGIEKEGQHRVFINLLGEEGTSGKKSTEAPAEGEYKPDADKFMKVRGASIYTFADGKEKKTSLNASKLKGSVKVDSSSDGKFTATVDLTDGDNTIKGSFEAKAWK